MPRDLLTVSDGNVPSHEAKILISHICSVVSTVHDIKADAHLDLANNFGNPSWLCKKKIFALKNTSVAKINEEMLKCLPGSLQTYKPVDTTADQQEVVPYPVEF